MKHLTTPTRSFLYIILITLSTAYIAIFLASTHGPVTPGIRQSVASRRARPTPEPLMSTAGWNTYIDNAYPVQFDYPANWKVKTSAALASFFTATLTSPEGNKITVYMSKEDFFALHGFATDSYTLDGYTGVTWRDTIVGVKVGENYYTFDGSQNPRELPEFKALLSTVHFTQAL